MSVGQGINAIRSPMAIVGFSVRAAAQCAVRDGFEVVAVDMCADRDLLNICSTHIRLDNPNWPAILHERFAGIPLLLAGGMENRLSCVSQCHAVMRRPGATSEQLSSARRLDNWENWAKASEIGWPTSVMDTIAAAALLKKNCSETWLMKSMWSAGGSGTTEWNGTELLDEDSFLERNGKYIQKWVSGENIGVTFLSCEYGTTIVGVAKAWDADASFPSSKFTYRGSCGPTSLPNALTSKLQSFGQLVGRDSKIMGLWQADFILHHGDLFLIEINPRWSASMDLLDVVLDSSLVAKHNASICSSMSKVSFERFSETCIQRIEVPRKTLLGKLIVYAEEPVTVSDNLSDYWWNKRWESGFFHEPSDGSNFYFADIPCAGSVIARGDPILTVMTTGTCPNLVWEALQVAQSNVLSQ